MEERADELLVTGFGPFLDVADNPSGAMARSADGRVVRGARVVGRVLPVSVARVPGALDAELVERRPLAIVCFGVQREGDWRVEVRARVPLTAEKDDVDGASPRAVAAGVVPEERRTALDVPALVVALRGAGLAARVSDDAGGYVCEWLYFNALGRAAERGIPAVFVHVPPRGSVAEEERERALAVVLEHVALVTERRAR